MKVHVWVEQEGKDEWVHLLYDVPNYRRTYAIVEAMNRLRAAKVEGTIKDIRTTRE